MNVGVAIAATTTITVTSKVTFGKMQKTIFCWSVDDGAKRSKVKWDSEAQRKITAIWADVTTLTVLRGSCTESNGNSERFLDSDGYFCARGNDARLWKGEMVEPQKYYVRHFFFVLQLWCDRLFTVMFHTVNVTVAVIFAVVWLPPKVPMWMRGTSFAWPC